MPDGAIRISSVDEPLVSICIPIYNGSGFVDHCLSSVTAQTYRNLDVLIIDNASTDDTAERARAWSRRDPRIRVVINERNIGLVPNRNRSIELARGEWIKFMDVDDELEPAAVDRLLAAAREHECRMATCRRIFRYEDVDERQQQVMEREVRRFEVREILPGQSWISAQEMARVALAYRGRNFIGEPTAVLLHRSVFEEFGRFNEDLVQIPDLELWLRVGVHTGMVYVDEPLSFFRIHDGAASAENQALRAFRADRLDQLVLLHEFLFNAHYEPLRQFADEIGLLQEMIADFHRRATRLALRAALDGRSPNPSLRQHWGQWRIVSQNRPRMRPLAYSLLPLAAFILKTTRVHR